MNKIFCAIVLSIGLSAHAAKISQTSDMHVVSIQLEKPSEKIDVRLKETITRNDCNPRGVVGDFKLANAENETANTLIVADFATRNAGLTCPLTAPVSETVYSPWFSLIVVDRLVFRLIVPTEYEVETRPSQP